MRRFFWGLCGLVLLAVGGLWGSWAIVSAATTDVRVLPDTPHDADIVVTPAEFTVLHDPAPLTTTHMLTITNQGNEPLSWVVIPDIPVSQNPLAGRYGYTMRTASVYPAELTRFAIEIPALWDPIFFGPEVQPAALDFVDTDHRYLLLASQTSNIAPWYQLDVQNRDATVLFTTTLPTDARWNGLTWDATGGVVYATADNCNQGIGTTWLYRVAPDTGTQTLIDAVNRCIVEVAAHPDGDLYALEAGDPARLLKVNKTNGDLTIIGPTTGAEASLEDQGLDFDDETGELFWKDGEVNIYEIDPTSAQVTNLGYLPNFYESAGLALDPTVRNCVGNTYPTWLVSSHYSGTTDPGASTAITLTIRSAGLVSGDYSALLCITSNDPDTPLVQIPIHFTVNTAGLVVDPLTVEETHDPGGQVTTQTMTLTNEGAGPLAWNIAEDGLPRDPSAYVRAYGWRNGPSSIQRFVSFDLANPASVRLENHYTGYEFNGGDFAGEDTTLLFVWRTNGELWAWNTVTGAIGSAGPAGPWYMSGMSWDATTKTMFALADYCTETTSTLYRLDLATATQSSGGLSVIGDPIPTCLGDIAVHPTTGQIFAIDYINDRLVTLDRTTAALVDIGPLGFDADARLSMDFDERTQQLHLAVLNLTASQNQIRVIDMETGESTLIAPFGNGQYALEVLAIEPRIHYCEIPVGVPWADVSPESGTIDAGTTQTLTITFESAGLPVGTYEGRLCLESNDPVAPALELPITLNVPTLPTPTHTPTVTPTATATPTFTPTATVPPSTEATLYLPLIQR